MESIGRARGRSEAHVELSTSESRKGLHLRAKEKFIVLCVNSPLDHPPDGSQSDQCVIQRRIRAK
ncbi:hypothetical protein COCNU_11G008260 [Cocos nucifera]|uniref:Uncharacterized protein n=1 Tax=Cocos nucifera TaxID=13894 RepID=A0A8K0IPJ4_COCNU|nr:hypothetical protein COCNU_11G008260 [Cocos nucifera]